jgi:hypothetical protein
MARKQYREVTKEIFSINTFKVSKPGLNSENTSAYPILCVSRDAKTTHKLNIHQQC